VDRLPVYPTFDSAVADPLTIFRPSSSSIDQGWVEAVDIEVYFIE
jgi:hypothetical protein